MRDIGQRRKPPYAGLIHWYWIPETQTHIGLFDGADEDAGFDIDGGRWQTVCEEHGSICSHETKADARASTGLAEWCEECMDIYDARKETP